MSGAPALGPTGLPLINAGGLPAICTPDGCCEEEDTPTVACAFCDINNLPPAAWNIKAENINHSLNTICPEHCTDYEGVWFNATFSGSDQFACGWNDVYSLMGFGSTDCGGPNDVTVGVTIFMSGQLTIRITYASAFIFSSLEKVIAASECNQTHVITSSGPKGFSNACAGDNTDPGPYLKFTATPA